MSETDIRLFEDPSPEEGFEGMYCGVPGEYEIDDYQLDVDLHAAAKYLRAHNLTELTEDVRKMFPLKK